MPDFAKALHHLRPEPRRRRFQMDNNPVSSLARQLSFLKARLLPPERAAIEGDEEVTPLGRHLLIRRSYDNEHYHGKVRLGRFSVTDLEHFMILMKQKSGAASRDEIVFLDTETTGIQGGTGMVPFLVGIGFFEGDTFRTTQYFIRDFDEEASMLLALRETLGRFKLLVTYNGATFDVPLLETRFTLAKLSTPFQDMAHLDLLPPARRLWRNGHGSCRLMALEQKIVAFMRGPDIPGAMIPRAYFDFLQGRGVSIMAGVLQHNLHDIVSLAALTVCACDRVTAEPAILDDPLDLYSLARVMENTADWKRAAEFYEMALRGGIEDPFLIRAQENLAMLSRRMGNHDRALALCETLMAQSTFSMVAHESAAIYHERVKGDAPRALEIVERALARLETLAENKRWRASLETRRDRLRQKMIQF
jgi:uncharacterized protein YprB with RNaseH-like and TPR domain